MEFPNTNFVITSNKNQMFLSLWKDRDKLLEWLTARSQFGVVGISDLNLWIVPDNPSVKFRELGDNGYRLRTNLHFENGILWSGEPGYRRIVF